jgi:hypothetical protein
MSKLTVEKYQEIVKNDDYLEEHLGKVCFKADTEEELIRKLTGYVKENCDGNYGFGECVWKGKDEIYSFSLTDQIFIVEIEQLLNDWLNGAKAFYNKEELISDLRYDSKFAYAIYGSKDYITTIYSDEELIDPMHTYGERNDIESYAYGFEHIKGQWNNWWSCEIGEMSEENLLDYSKDMKNEREGN